MQPAARKVRLTYRDLERLPEDRFRHELIDGEHIVTPSPSVRHQQIVGKLHVLLWLYLREHPIGTVLGSPIDVALSLFDLVVPDLVFFTNARWREVVTEKRANGAPNLIVEVASPSTRRRDEKVKLELYERFGVDEYWIVDPKREAVRIHLREGPRFGVATELARVAGDVLESPMFPGLLVSLSDVFPTPDIQ